GPGGVLRVCPLQAEIRSGDRVELLLAPAGARQVRLDLRGHGGNGQRPIAGRHGTRKVLRAAGMVAGQRRPGAEIDARRVRPLVPGGDARASLRTDRGARLRPEPLQGVAVGGSELVDRRDHDVAMLRVDPGSRGRRQGRASGRADQDLTGRLHASTCWRDLPSATHRADIGRWAKGPSRPFAPCSKSSHSEGETMITRLKFGVLLAAFAARPALAQQAEPAHPWSYEGAKGPAHWGDLKSEYAACKTGKHQSPIDIRNEKPADLPAIEFSYAPAPFRIVDNGHSVQITVDPGSSISAGGKRYDLVQFHFHHPSEERIHGKAYPMVAHLVHKDEVGKLAVVAVLLKSGHQNPFIEELWKNLPADVEQEHAPAGKTVDLSQLLPKNRGYYTFTGSLT